MKSTLQLFKSVTYFLLGIIFISKSYGQEGTLDTSFGNGGTDTIGMVVTTEEMQKEQVSKILVQRDQKVVAVGAVWHEPSFGSAAALVRYNSDGSSDKLLYQYNTEWNSNQAKVLKAINSFLPGC